MSLTAKTILVTGASRGIGLEFIKQILKLPTAPEVVFAACRNPSSAPELQELAKSNQTLKLLKLDVGKDEEIHEAVKEVKGIVGDRGLNLLINNAGINIKNGSDLRNTTRASLQQHFDVNTTSPIILAQNFLPLLEQAALLQKSQPMSCNKAGLVNISSIMGSQQITLELGKGTSYQYKCSKTAVSMATVLMARELKEQGIMCISVHPGWVKTDMGGSAADLTTEQSVAGCLNVFSTQTEENTGKLIDYKGEVLPF